MMEIKVEALAIVRKLLQTFFNKEILYEGKSI